MVVNVQWIIRWLYSIAVERQGYKSSRGSPVSPSETGSHYTSIHITASHLQIKRAAFRNQPSHFLIEAVCKSVCVCVRWRNLDNQWVWGCGRFNKIIHFSAFNSSLPVLFLERYNHTLMIPISLICPRLNSALFDFGSLHGGLLMNHSRSFSHINM